MWYADPVKTARRTAGNRGDQWDFRSFERSLFHQSSHLSRQHRHLPLPLPAEGWTDGKGVLTVWVYENTSFELAKDVESQTFPWTEEGVEQIKVWLEQKLEERGSQPYFIPYPAPRAE